MLDFVPTLLSQPTAYYFHMYLVFHRHSALPPTTLSPPAPKSDWQVLSLVVSAYQKYPAKPDATAKNITVTTTITTIAILLFG